MNWYLWELKWTLGLRVIWFGWTRRPGYMPWGSRSPGLIRAGWLGFDFGYVNKPVRFKDLELHGI